MRHFLQTDKHFITIIVSSGKCEKSAALKPNTFKPIKDVIFLHFEIHTPVILKPKQWIKLLN